MFATLLLAACSDYELHPNASDIQETVHVDAQTPPETDVATAPGYPLSLLLDDCFGLDEALCAYDVHAARHRSGLRDLGNGKPRRSR